MASSASDCRRDIIHRWSLLVRMVRLQSRYPLDRAYPFWAPHWFRSPIHLPPIPQLPCGCLSHVVSGTSLFLYTHVKKKEGKSLRSPSQRRFRHRCKHTSPFPCWRRIPLIRSVYVCIAQGELRWHPPRLCRPRPRPYSSCLLEIRPQIARTIEVCPHAKAAGTGRW